MYLLYFLIALAAVCLYLYNRAVKLRTLIEEAWSGIDVHLRERRNVIPSLVESVKGYAAHEQKTFEETAAHRTAAQAASKRSELAKEETALSDGVAKIFALAEDYPDLKASQNFTKLQDQLVEIEDKLQYARRYYNGTVRNYNTYIQSVPFVFAAEKLNFEPAEFFEISLATERSNPDVSFN